MQITGSNDCVVVLTRPWAAVLADLVGSAESHLLVCAPFVSSDGTKVVRNARRNALAVGSSSLVLTDLSPRAVSAGATDPQAVAALCAALPGSRLVHLPRLHAKVYCVDGKRAVVTSGNLTHGGLVSNRECGVFINDTALVGGIEREMLAYADLGAEIDKLTLDRYCEVASEVRAACKAEVDSASRAARQRLSQALLQADDELIKARLGQGALHTLFARTILFLLRHDGPMTTVQLHARIQSIHPDLCDDAVDRVIAGKRFGKKWKHAVRTAQQQLKKRGYVREV